MGVYDLFRTIAQSSLSTKERAVNQIKYDVASDFEGSPSYEEVSINGSETLTGVHIVTDKKDNKTMLSKPDETFVVGDIVEWNSNKFLVIDIDENQNIQTKGTILLCNNVLKFYNKDDETSILWVLNEVPCIFSDISIDMHEGRYMNLPIGHYNILIPSGYVKKSDLNLRFILNDAAYKIEGISNAANGLTKIEIEDDEFIPDDNRSLGIANYYSHQAAPTPVLVGQKIIISPLDDSIVKGSTKIFTASIYNDEVEDVTSRTIWIITNKDGTYTPYCLMTYDNRTCTLKAGTQSDYVGKVINLRILLEENENVYIDKEIVVSSFI
jgi:hypothetical protein